MYAPPKVSQLDHTKTVEQVLWLYISVDNIFRVDVLECLANLQNVSCCFCFRVAAKRLVVFKVFVQFTLRAVLEDKVDLILVVKEAI